MLGEICIVAILIIMNGFLAMSELAIIASRPARLQAMLRSGVRSASRALELLSNPGKFLSTVQIGITAVGILSGAFSGATLGRRLSALFMEKDMPAGIAEPFGMVIVVVAVTYISLIIGELVPKQIALHYRETIAVRIAPVMCWLSKMSAPLVWVFDSSGKAILRLMGQNGAQRERITNEEIRFLVAEAENDGVIESDERRMITGVMRLGNRAARALMTPRTGIEWLNLNSDKEEIRKLLILTQHSRLPAGEGSIDAVTGIIQTRDLLAAALANEPFEPTKHLRTAPIVHDQADALDILNILKNSDMPMVLVHDEYGHFEGIITPADILKAIVGVFRSDLDANEPKETATQREDGSWLLEGSMPADEMAELLNIPLEENRDYETIAGYLLSYFNRLPETGETVTTEGWRFEVVDLDGRRIDKVIATRIST